MNPSRRSSLTARTMGEEIIIHDDRTEELHVLTDNAMVAWNLLDGTRSAGELLQACCEAGTKSESGKIEDEIRDILRTLAMKGLVDPPGFDFEVAWLEEAIIRKPDSANGHIRLGVLHLGRGRVDEAGAAFTKAREIDPDSRDAAVNLATILFMKGRVDEADAIMSLVAEKHPDDSGVLNNLGNIKSNKGQKEDAIRLYERAIELRPDYPDALVNLASCRRQGGDEKEAEELYRRVLKDHPAQRGALKGLLEMLIKARRHEDAIQVLETAREARPDDLETLDTLAGLYMQLGNTGAAFDLFEKAKALVPGPDDARHQNLANLKRILGR